MHNSISPIWWHSQILPERKENKVPRHNLRGFSLLVYGHLSALLIPSVPESYCLDDPLNHNSNHATVPCSKSLRASLVSRAIFLKNRKKKTPKLFKKKKKSMPWKLYHSACFSTLPHLLETQTPYKILEVFCIRLTFPIFLCSVYVVPIVYCCTFSVFLSLHPFSSCLSVSPLQS